MKIDYYALRRDWRKANFGRKPTGVILSDEAYQQLIADMPPHHTASAPPEYVMGLKITVDPNATEHAKITP